MKAMSLLLCLAFALSPSAAPAQAAGEWPAYGRDAGGTRYSPLAQITRDNVKDLQLTWIYRTGDYLRDRTRFEATPLVVDGVLYVSTPLGRVIALDPATGAERWVYDARVSLEGDYGDFANRGVATWLDAAQPQGRLCRRRIFLATVDARLIALDARAGRPCADFGARGQVDLAAGLRNAPDYRYEYGVTSPPVVVAGLVVVGSAISDNQRVDAPEGAVRAFDARTGTLRWKWDPIPPALGAPGAANAWSVLSADSALGLVFVPTGSASPDFYGGERPGDNRHANSVVALRAATGQVAWAFQVVHHDLWDNDVPAQPVLFVLRRDGRSIPAVAVATKMGHLFLLDRRTGEPLAPVQELPVPASDVPGEKAWPTQPFPAAALRLAPESLTPADAYGRTDQARQWCRDRIAALRYEGVFTPPSLRGTIIFPGNIGGMNWSGVSVDERRGLLIAPTNRLAMIVTLVPQDSLHAVRMAHPNEEVSRQRGTPYGMMRQVLVGPDGVPCTPPPWGAIAAVDLNAADPKVLWQTPIGSGVINLGGAAITAGGLVFIAGAMDERIRALDEETGRELWSAVLPAGAHALPMTFLARGRQYVVVTAGGHDRLRTKMGDFVLAFALPGSGAPILDTVPGPLAGTYSGEIRVGAARIGLDVTIATTGDSLSTAVSWIDSIQVSGPVVARRAGTGLAIAVPFTYPAKHCGGSLTATGELWNAGGLLEGDVVVTGTCGGGPAEHGTFALWRRGR
jgi:quinoprotein glucose dehydrogenase